MRAGFSILTSLLVATATTATACSLFVSTDGLSGGGGSGDDGGATAPQGAGGGPSTPGVALGDASAGPAPVVASGSDAAAPVVPSPPGIDPTSTSDASTVDASAPDTSTGVDAAPTACSVGRARVFLTSAMYDGNLGGVSGADADCAASAAAQGLGGQWLAWLSDSYTSASDHVYAAPNGYVLLDGTLVASSHAALVSGSIAHAIDVTELGVQNTDGNTEVWTGIDVTGAMGSYAGCQDKYGDDWASRWSGATTPIVGHSDATDSTWTAAYLQTCDRANVRLYCFEVCP